ncbi:S41 family peptidase [Sorangium cellulosum]|uniref:S41 family peptidase n=1 Tax=Sorangium cellulosum TaxID=56 RepID=UPI00040CE586|nr:S41 family peptidase [Sorangium cellulosum]
MPPESSLRRPRRAATASRSFVALACAALACAALACAPAPAVAPSQAPAPLRSLRIADGDLDGEPRTVSSAEAILDLDDARYAFEHAYAGLDGRSPAPAPLALARAAAALRGRAAWRPGELARLLRDVFAAPDGHLAFGHGGRAPLRLTAAPATAPAAPAPAPAAPATCAGRGADARTEAPARRSDAPRRAGPPVELTRSRDGVPVLAIRTFSTAAAPALAALPALAAELRRAPAFVVDLRGNAGGNYLFAERFALALTDAPLCALDEREVLSVAAAEGRANSARRRLERGDVPPEARPRFVEHLAALERLAGALRGRAADRSGAAPRVELTTRGALVRGRAAGPLEGRAVFLVDRGCASACEMLLALARQIPGVLVVGQNTRGGMSVGEIALFRLPRSGVTLSFGTRAYRDPLGDFVELRGFEPDVRLDGAALVEDAAALALRGAPSGAPRRGARTSCAPR